MLDPLLSKPGTTLWAVVHVTGACVLGIVMLSASLIGYFRSAATLIERALLFVGACCLIFPGLATDAAGLVLGAVALGLQLWRAQSSSRRSSP
jgi:TRAP-type uncharacterized transport system fused permease subunit